MVAITDNHPVGWVAPSPLWARFGDLAQSANRERFARPAILRFAHDAFMDELLALLAYYPEHLDEWLARYETWERPMRTPPTAARLTVPDPVSQLSTRLIRGAAAKETAAAPVTVDDSAANLKLYQPVHQRHYLVTASLVCRRTGLPDRRVDPSRQEQVRFVLRRLLPAQDAAGTAATDPGQFQEYAFVKNGNAGEWRPVGTQGDALFDGEERLPMFPLGVELDANRKRKLLGGVIPVGRREAYVGAPVRAADDDSSDSAAAPATDTRLLLLQMQVTGPWSELVGQSLDRIERLVTTPTGYPSFAGDPPSPANNADAIRRAREQIQTISWYILLDLARYLSNQVPRIWEVLGGSRPRTDLDPTQELPLLEHLEQFQLAVNKADLIVDSAYGTGAIYDTLAQVLQAFADDANLATGLEAVEGTYDRTAPDAQWPDFLFPLADVGQHSALEPGDYLHPKTGPFPFRIAGFDLSGGASRGQTLANVADALAQLETLIEEALPAEPEHGMPEVAVPTAAAVDTREAWFTIRCVYERPNCGPRSPYVLSLPTEPFRMASFFDPDAPARPVRIPMPLDISPAGLRKFNKNASMMVSDALCGQLKRIRKFTLGDLVLSVLPWPFHKDLPDPTAAKGCTDSSGNAVGMFCSLSIPIVTICALVLMMIMVSLFDLFFRWVPYLFLCLPIPGLKGKKS